MCITTSNQTLNLIITLILTLTLLQNIVTCPTYPDKFIRDNVVALSVLVLIVIITPPFVLDCKYVDMWTFYSLFLVLGCLVYL